MGFEKRFNFLFEIWTLVFNLDRFLFAIIYFSDTQFRLYFDDLVMGKKDVYRRCLKRRYLVQIFNTETRLIKPSTLWNKDAKCNTSSYQILQPHPLLPIFAWTEDSVLSKYAENRYKPSTNLKYNLK
jgi:hypothetical protein